MTIEGKPIRVLLVDDSLSMLWGLGKLVQGEFPRMTLIGTARSGDEALVYAYLRPNVTVLDLDLDGYSSIEIIPALRERSGGCVLIHTGLGDQRLHDDAMLFGAMGVVKKDAPAAQILQAIECVQGGTFWNHDPALIVDSGAETMPRADDAAARGADFLAAAEQRLIADIVGRWQAASPDVRHAPLVLEQLVAIYNKLGLRNRVELARFAAEHSLTLPID